jgi:hypothetical protein
MKQCGIDQMDALQASGFFTLRCLTQFRLLRFGRLLLERSAHGVDAFLPLLCPGGAGRTREDMLLDGLACAAFCGGVLAGTICSAFGRFPLPPVTGFAVQVIAAGGVQQQWHATHQPPVVAGEVQPIRHSQKALHLRGNQRIADYYDGSLVRSRRYCI